MSTPTRASKVITTQDAIDSFTKELVQGTALNTQKKYRLLLKKLGLYALEREILSITDWSPLAVREFRASWGVQPQTAAKNMSTIKAFFEYCVSNEWLSKNPARMVTNHRGRDSGDKRNEQKLPFTDEELQRMFAACATHYGKKPLLWDREHPKKPAQGQHASYATRWTGDDLADFIALSVHTGLRISDVSTFSIDRLKPNGEIELRTTKSGTHVSLWVPEWLQERIRERARTTGPHIFGTHNTKDLNVITDGWRRKLKRLWELCGFAEEGPNKPTPHRFRHTFARILLQRPGITVRDVAELLGNTEQMVRQHYAAWIPERQERLTRILKEAFAEHQPGITNAPVQPRSNLRS